MKLINTGSHHGLFKLLAITQSAQAAMMVLKPGESSDDHPSNEHPRSDQWLYVISGAGKARVNNRTVRLKSGHLLLIEKRELHQITNTSRLRRLVTINFYAPPAYTPSGDPR